MPCIVLVPGITKPYQPRRKLQKLNEGKHFENSALLPAADRGPEELATPCTSHVGASLSRAFSRTPPCTHISSFCSWPARLYLSWNLWRLPGLSTCSLILGQGWFESCLDIVKSGGFAQKGQRERPEQRHLSSWPLTRLGRASALPGAGSFRPRGRAAQAGGRTPVGFPVFRRVS